jgi:hypothetical protein
MPVSTTALPKHLGVTESNIMIKYIYKSNKEAFLSWDIWVSTFGSLEEIDLHHSLDGDPEAKEKLYQKWLKDQDIIQLITEVDDVVTQTMNWNWD